MAAGAASRPSPDLLRSSLDLDSPELQGGGSSWPGKHGSAAPLDLTTTAAREARAAGWACAYPCLAARLWAVGLPPAPLTALVPAVLLLALPPDGAPAAWTALSICCPGLPGVGVVVLLRPRAGRPWIRACSGPPTLVRWQPLLLLPPAHGRFRPPPRHQAADGSGCHQHIQGHAFMGRVTMLPPTGRRFVTTGSHRWLHGGCPARRPHSWCHGHGEGRQGGCRATQEEGDALAGTPPATRCWLTLSTCASTPSGTTT